MNESVKKYRFWTFDEVVASGKISAEDLQKAIDTKQIRVTIEHPSKKEWINGRELHQVLGILNGQNGFQ